MIGIRLALTVAAGLALNATSSASATSASRACGLAGGTGQGTTVHAANVSCATARRIVKATASGRCFSPAGRPHPCTIEGYACRIAFHSAHDGAGFTITRCTKGRAQILGKTGP